MKRQIKTHNINPLFAILKLYLKVRGEEFKNISNIKKPVLFAFRLLLGWASFIYPLFLGIYPRFHWFSASAAQTAAKTRDDLLEKLSGRVGSTAGGSKFYTGSLSRGCHHCIEGDWACNFINRLCNRDCFFCKRSHRVIREEPEAETWGFFFPDPSAHISYLKKFNIGGVSFSGGEPLLVRDRLLQHLSAVRKEFGASIYTWMYTNGDLVNREILEQLRDAGLQEIRFNIAAREYDLTPAVLAKKFIPVVTVEIPCIPEDHECLKALLPAMEEAGINFLNLHQLTVEEQNCRDLIRRDYHLTGIHPGISVYESEIAALELLLHTCDSGLKLPVNYCSSAYKHRYQGRGFRKQRASAFPLGYEELTDTGYLRRISVSAPKGKIQELAANFTKNTPDRSLWKTSGDGGRIILHSSLLCHLAWPGFTIDITYLIPGVAAGPGSERLEADNLRENRKIISETRGLDHSLFDLWFRLYIKKECVGSNPFVASDPPGKDRSPLRDEILKMKPYEIRELGFPEVI